MSEKVRATRIFREPISSNFHIRLHRPRIDGGTDPRQNRPDLIMENTSPIPRMPAITNPMMPSTGTPHTNGFMPDCMTSADAIMSAEMIMLEAMRLLMTSSSETI